MSWLLDEIGFKQLTDEEKEYLEDVAADTISNRVINRVAALFDKEQLGSIRHLFENGSESEIAEFLRSHQLNFDELIDEELGLYRQEMKMAKEMLTNSDG
ncbi:MAG: hypothetical protein Q7K33_03650 [Candidatus Berkelbacteria bacterium]|nr:hypothetical protein [Candidatus Berkelbacteria bacterium]